MSRRRPIPDRYEPRCGCPRRVGGHSGCFFCITCGASYVQIFEERDPKPREQTTEAA